MAEKNLVNETLLQIQNLEEVINENAKEILASTMKEEISELVKESMKEDDEDLFALEEDESELSDEDFIDDESEDESEEEFEIEDESEEDESEEDESEEDEFEIEDESDVVDFSGLPDTDETAEMIAKVFKNMKDTDEITIVQDGDYLHLTDEPADTEYLIQTEGDESKEEYEMEEEMYEGWNMEEDTEDKSEEFGEGFDHSKFEDNEKDEVVYEIEVGDESTYQGNEDLEEDFDELEFEFDDESEGNETYTPMMESKKSKKMETKEGMKAKVGKGAKLGSPKFTYKKQSGGFNEKKKQGKTVGLGKGPKFEFKEGEMMDMPAPKGTKKLSKEEAMEAARTYGFGSKSGRGLRKGVTDNRNYEYGKNVAESVEVMEELQMLRAKNEEYRKALNLFRDKLNEVAIFNSNLAYATRLFTEHSTSKQEKINILRRFDSAETLKESKALYKTIKDELSSTTKAAPITESIERVIVREPQSGSAVNLIESKTYENPQFLRMKDIMSKIAK